MSGGYRLSVEQMKGIIPETSVRAEFLARPEIAALSPEEQARRWATRREIVEKFLSYLTSVDCIGILEDDPR